MNLEQRFPAGPPTSVTELVAQLGEEPADGQLVVGDERVRDFLVSLGRRLLSPAVGRRFPELGSLGFFLRRGELDRALETIAEKPGQLRFPRGLVFHIPPANVDTIFVYSWALAALAGNRNIVRVSSRSAGAAQLLLDTLNDALAQAHPAIGQTQRMVTYGRDDAVTEALSHACDLRVIWGGDRSVTEIRRFPLRPSSRDLTFPDRSSFAVLATSAWNRADAAEQQRIAEQLYNDVYWFDQAACSSPRVLFWVGPAVQTEQARQELTERLATVVAQRSPGIDAAMAVQKHVSTYGLAAEGVATRIRFHGNEIADVALAGVDVVPRVWLGAGTLAHARVDSLLELVPLVTRQDQTISHVGFTEDELVAFARALGGRGVDRLVPLGRALAFAPVWDGYDLLHEFTRLTTVLTR